MRRGSLRVRAAVVVTAAVLAGLAAPIAASAAIPASLTLPANCAHDSTSPEDYFFCDDGIPNAGGTFPNLTGASAVTVPAKYGGDTYTGLRREAPERRPIRAPTRAATSRSTSTSPIRPRLAFPGPRPLLVFMHGCCAGSKTSWEPRPPAPLRQPPASYGTTTTPGSPRRGYVVLNYTARGFVNGSDHGTRPGETQLDSRSFEINDFQSLAGQVTDDAFNRQRNAARRRRSKVVVTGGSYGGGFSWMALDRPDSGASEACAGPSFNFNMGRSAVAPKYGWTDLASRSFQPADTPLARATCPRPRAVPYRPTATPSGGRGAHRRPEALDRLGAVHQRRQRHPAGHHTTFPSSIVSTFACTQGPDLSPSGSSCPGVTTTLSDFIRDRSAYYQQDFFNNLAANPSYAIPVYAAGTFTDWLFPSTEHRRMVDRLPRSVPTTRSRPTTAIISTSRKTSPRSGATSAPTAACTSARMPISAATSTPRRATRVREGITTRLNAFVDHYALPGSAADLGTPAFDTTAELEVCPQNAASLGVDAGQGGPQFNAASFEALAPNTLTIDASGSQTTTNKAAPNTHAVNDDPVKNLAANGGKCPVETDDAGSGVASYSTDALPRDFTMLGSTAISVTFAATGPVAQMDARLYDVKPNGNAILVDRGPRRLRATEASSGQATYELFGSGWRFPAGDKIRIELMQDDDPFLHFTETASSASLSKAVLRIPIREASATLKAGPTLQKGFCANKTVGTKLGEKLKGTKASDRILGRGGRDRISGLGDRDCLAGGAKKDRIAAGKGRDRVSGGKGRDRLNGGRGGTCSSAAAARTRSRVGPGATVSGLAITSAMSCGVARAAIARSSTAGTRRSAARRSSAGAELRQVLPWLDGPSRVGAAPDPGSDLGRLLPVHKDRHPRPLAGNGRVGPRPARRAGLVPLANSRRVPSSSRGQSSCKMLCVSAATRSRGRSC